MRFLEIFFKKRKENSTLFYNIRLRVIQKNFFGHYAWEEEGFLAFFWSKFTKNVAGEGGGGGGKNVEK
jgi:hypothetical protein